MSSNQQLQYILADGYALNTADGYSFLSAPCKVNSCTQIGVTIIFVGGTPSGTVKLQSTCEPDDETVRCIAPGSPLNAGSGGIGWVDVANTSTSISAAGVTQINLANFGGRWVRVSYVATSGTSTLSIYLTGKM
jgi:hypothetical protein